MKGRLIRWRWSLVAALGIAALPVADPAMAAALGYQVLDNGSVRILDADHELARIEPGVKAPDGIYQLSAGSADGAGGCQAELHLGAQGRVAVTARVVESSQGLRLRYTLTPRSDLQVNTARVAVYLPYGDWQGAAYRLGAEGGTCLPGYRMPVLAAAAGRLDLGPAEALDGLKMRLEPGEATVLLMDYRQWSPQLVPLLTHGEPRDGAAWSWKAGDAKRFDLTLHFDRPLVKGQPARTAGAGGLAGDWHGVLVDGHGRPCGRLAFAALQRSNGSWGGRFIIDHDDLSPYSVQTPQWSVDARSVVARYGDGTELSAELDGAGQALKGRLLCPWRDGLTFTLARGSDYLQPRLDLAKRPVLRYAYRPPADRVDGLPVGDLRHGGADLAGLERSVNRALDGSLAGLHSLLLMQRGSLVLDEYFYGYGPRDAHELHSVTKSIFSALFGIAQGQGLVDVGQKLYDLYPQERDKPDRDRRKDSITLGMLLGMSSGFRCDDMDMVARTEVFRSPDWVAAALGLPLAKDPGTHWTYNGTSLLPLSATIAKKSGMSIPDYAQKYLEGPLGIAPHPWNEAGPHGVTGVDAGHVMTPREMAKVGQLFLDHGLWKGRRILPEGWAEAVGVKRAPDFDYGYLFWLKTAYIQGKAYPVIEANGWGGQYIFIVPQAEVVGVMTAGNYQMGDAFGAEEACFMDEILPALVQR